MSTFEMAKKYYPTLWNTERIKNLVRKGKLTPEQFKEITGEDYDE